MCFKNGFIFCRLLEIWTSAPAPDCHWQLPRKLARGMSSTLTLLLNVPSSCKLAPRPTLPTLDSTHSHARKTTVPRIVNIPGKKSTTASATSSNLCNKCVGCGIYLQSAEDTKETNLLPTKVRLVLEVLRYYMHLLANDCLNELLYISVCFCVSISTTSNHSENTVIKINILTLLIFEFKYSSLFMLFGQYHACWCPGIGSSSHQGISRNGTDGIGQATRRVAAL